MMLFFFYPEWAGAYWGVVGSKIGLFLGGPTCSGCDTAGLQSLDATPLFKDKKKEMVVGGFARSRFAA